MLAGCAKACNLTHSLYPEMIHIHLKKLPGNNPRSHSKPSGMQLCSELLTGAREPWHAHHQQLVTPPLSKLLWHISHLQQHLHSLNLHAVCLQANVTRNMDKNALADKAFYWDDIHPDGRTGTRWDGRELMRRMPYQDGNGLRWKMQRIRPRHMCDFCSP